MKQMQKLAQSAALGAGGGYAVGARPMDGAQRAGHGRRFGRVKAFFSRHLGFACLLGFVAVPLLALAAVALIGGVAGLLMLALL